MVDIKNPLTEDDLKRLDDVIARADEADELAERIKSAGIDIGDRQQRIKQGRDKARKIRNTFFPNR